MAARVLEGPMTDTTSDLNSKGSLREAARSFVKDYVALTKIRQPRDGVAFAFVEGVLSGIEFYFRFGRIPATLLKQHLCQDVALSQTPQAQEVPPWKP